MLYKRVRNRLILKEIEIHSFFEECGSGGKERSIEKRVLREKSERVKRVERAAEMWLRRWADGKCFRAVAGKEDRPARITQNGSMEIILCQ